MKVMFDKIKEKGKQIAMWAGIITDIGGVIKVVSDEAQEWFNMVRTAEASEVPEDREIKGVKITEHLISDSDLPPEKRSNSYIRITGGKK